MNSKVSKVVNNTAMLYIMSIAKLIFPLLTFPYLTRVLSEDAYGFVSYTKTCMTYIQLIIDFGFILSSVKDIVNANGNTDKIGRIAGTTFMSKLMLTAVSALALAVMCFSIKVLKINVLFVVLSFVAVACTVFLADFLFRGIEKMHYITVIYLISKAVSTLLTFVLVKGDGSIMWIPILDIVSNVISVLITFIIIAKLKIPVRFGKIKECIIMIKDSFFYFLSSVATTAFSALNTLLIGIYMPDDLGQVAKWAVCMQIISAIQGLYAPICNGVYPHMIKQKSLKFIHKLLAIFMPVVTVGCVLCLLLSKTALFVVGGEKYIDSLTITLFRCLIPILFFSLPAQVYGWPTLGAIGKVKSTTASTIITAIVQILGLTVLILTNCFNLISLALLRCFTEILLMAIRMTVTYKNKKCFIGDVTNE